MKKLLLVLLVVTLAAFLLVGCIPVTPNEGEGEGEGEATVAIEGSVVVEGKTYVSGGNHKIVITFSKAVAGNVEVTITGCTGDYRAPADTDVVMFPDTTRKIWTGSGTFGGDGVCCASYVEVYSGECIPEACIVFPVIVDSDTPYARIKVTSKECTCEGCAVTFESKDVELPCDTTECCGDDCSGLASWAIAIYEKDPFDKCCDTPCEEPIDTCSGTTCPILCTTDCLDAGKSYYVVASLIDKVGNEEEYYAIIKLDTACGVTVTEYFADTCDYNNCLCTNWVCEKDTDEFIGNCEPLNECSACCE